MKYWLKRNLLFLLMGMLFTGCGEQQPSDSVCEDGETQTCTCDNGAEGLQSCMKDNTDWNACVCDPFDGYEPPDNEDDTRDPQSNSDTDVDTDSDTDVDSDSDTDTDSDSDLDTRSESDSDSDSDSETSSQTGEDTDDDSDSDTHTGDDTSHHTEEEPSDIPSAVDPSTEFETITDEPSDTSENTGIPTDTESDTTLPTDCECTSGACCDGCYILPDTTQCQEEPIRYNYRCSGNECGSNPMRQPVYRYCNGIAATCGDDNIKEGSWETTESCTAAEVCRIDTEGDIEGGYCYECQLGCDSGMCLEPECDEGPCCIDNHFAPSTRICDNTIMGTSYRCSSDNECGADAQRRYMRRNCTGASADCTNGNLLWGEWEDLDPCEETEACGYNNFNAWCSPCELGCSQGRCRECTQGLCCDNGFFADTDTPCESFTNYSCETGIDLCGGNALVGTTVRFCTGDVATCGTGPTAWQGWAVKEQCNSDAICQHNNSDAWCATCDIGCTGDACYPDCNPIDPCCDDTGTFRPSTHRCGVDPYRVEYRCSGSICGSDAEQRDWVEYCQGESADCPNGENLQPTEWIVGEACEENELCQSHTGGSSCLPCEDGCSEGRCLDCDQDSDCLLPGENNRWCNEGYCDTCVYDEHCGPECNDCTQNTNDIFCNSEGTGCVECREDAHCEQLIGPQEWCDNGSCARCLSDEHCGPNCDDCTETYRICSTDRTQCVECNTNLDCITGEWCHLETHACVTCNDDTHCGEDCENCYESGDVCNDLGTQCVECRDGADDCGEGFRCVAEICVPCDDEMHCGAGCNPCLDTEWCDHAGTGECIQCGEDVQHCGPECSDCTATPTTPVCDGDQCICTPDSCPNGEWCDEFGSGDCIPCGIDDEHCGPTCIDCTATLYTPVCDIDRCVCTSDSCPDGEWCDEEGAGLCVSCGEHDEHCGPECVDCSATPQTPLCSVDECVCTTDSCPDGEWCDDNDSGTCIACGDDDEHCGPACENCGLTPDTPHCDGSTCVECLVGTCEDGYSCIGGTCILDDPPDASVPTDP